MEDIFISYSKNDLKDAKNLANKLNSFGLSVWLDNLLNPGDFFNEVLTDKVSSSKVILVLWTENSVKSKWVHAEAAMALNQVCDIANYDPFSDKNWVTHFPPSGF